MDTRVQARDVSSAVAGWEGQALKLVRGQRRGEERAPEIAGGALQRLY